MGRTAKLGEIPPKLLGEHLAELLDPSGELVTRQPVAEWRPSLGLLPLQEERPAKQLRELELPQDPIEVVAFGSDPVGLDAAELVDGELRQSSKCALIVLAQSIEQGTEEVGGRLVLR